MKNRFLIVDDNALVRRATARLVEHITGCATQCCGSAGEALLAFKNAPDAFACVITDFNMPGMDGLELGSRINAIDPGVRLLLATANPGALSNTDIGRHGFDCLLAKPFDLAILEEALRRILPPLNNLPACGTHNLYRRSVSFFERSGGIQSAII